MTTDLNLKIENTRSELLEHPIYTSMESLEDVRIFMSHHVFAVWDFMSLLKALQIKLTGVQVPWFPLGEPGIRKMINEIVLGEESDSVVGGLSHFEWYLSAMEQCGAETQPMNELLTRVKNNDDYMGYIETLPNSIKQFVKFTLDLAINGETYEVAAAFTVGRENLIPDMFTELVNSLHKKYPEQLSNLIHYMERHIEVDGGDHGPMADRMLKQLCNNDPQKLARCEEVAIQCLESRKALWEGIYQELCYKNGVRVDSQERVAS